jgi:hypothetical protein
MTNENETNIPLLDLTPIYLQNTNNIINSLIFMNLDQGHDFHDGSARTKTSSGNSTWVDLDVKGKGFINQIKRSIFNIKYPDGNNILTSAKGEIFGNSDFIKGSLNTTFVGGNGAYGFVVIDDENLQKHNNSNISIEKNIIEVIKKNINIKILNLPDKIYFVGEGDTYGDQGRTFTIENNDDKEINILFLPFYQRVYNGSMHKLWSFNNIKHIYLIKISEITLNKQPNSMELSNPVFTCEKFTTISNITPQYVLNYNQFLNGIKKGDSNTFVNKFKKKLQDEGLFEQYKDYFIKNDKTIKFDLIHLLPENIQKIISNIFIASLITNDFNPNLIENIVSEGINSVNYDRETNKFILKISNIEFLDFISRGVKYHFENCGDKSFRHFLNLLYLNEKPYIHPNYVSNNTEVEMAKDKILMKLQGHLLDEYNNLIKNKILIEETNENFISKQYGFITDTNIGSNQTESTAEYIINSLNNTINIEKDIEGQSGGALENFPNDTQNFIKKITVGNNYLLISTYVTQILDRIQDKPNCSELQNELKDFIQEKYKKDISKDIIKYKCETETLGRETLGTEIKELDSTTSFLRQPQTSIETAVTTGETVSPITEETTPVTTTLDTIPITTVQGFDNISNVNEIFDLQLPSKLTEKFVPINAKSMKNSLDIFIDKYSNKLQLYYDFIKQNEGNISTNNYFNNCWQSTDFYQKGGGSYPFKFTVASGSLDSSSLGGQSLPQYHPPEIDIYMPIFQLDGDKSNLKGVIVRMVIVKEILNNPINSKSKVVVFCHFVYVDFERTQIIPPNDVSEYPEKIKALLDFTIKNTVYVKNKSNCVNLEELPNIKLNDDENIDFKLINLYVEGQTEKKSRNWYKYYTHTQGPTVKESIVIPVNYNTRSEIESGTNFDYVASGIVDVAEKLIDNSGKLREVFIDEKSQVQFIKLFLVRNKYTGDKSRSTDTLFLNQIKYLEGVQISNDENTLYNAQMLGLNTVWCTSSKSIFYMAPYMTPEGKFPITTGVYVEILKKGLKSNPNIKVYTPNKDESGGKVDDTSLIQSEIRDELMDTLDPIFISDYQKFIKDTKNPNNLTIGSGFIEQFVNGIFNYREKLNKQSNDFFEQCSFLDEFITKCDNDNKILMDDNCINIFNNDKNKESFPFKLNKLYEEIMYNITSIKDNLSGIYQSLFTFILQINKSDVLKNDIDSLSNLILYLSKTYPFWLKQVLDYKEQLIKYNYCKTYKNILNKIKILMDNSSSNEKKNYTSLYNKLNTKILVKNCDSITIPDENKILLKEYIPKTPDDVGYDANQELVNLEDNQLKYKILSKNFLDKLKQIKVKPLDSRKLDQITDNETLNIIKNPINEETKDKFRLFISKRKPRAIQKETASLGGATVFKGEPMEITDNNENNSEHMEMNNNNDNNDNKDEPMEISENTSELSQQIIEFYKNSYKCNVGNRVKNYIEIIKFIHEKYGKLLFEPVDIKDDNSTLVIKIFLINIDFINKSFSPVIDYNTIIKNFNVVDDNYTTEQMNSLLNLYSSQLNLYTLINDIILSDYTSLELANLLHDSTSDNTLNDLEIPYLKYELERKIIDENKLDNKSSEQVIGNKRTFETELMEPKPINSKKRPIESSSGISSEQLKKIQKSEIYDNTKFVPFDNLSFNNRAVGKSYAGSIKKNRKCKRFNKTIKKNKNKNLKCSKKKKYLKRRNYTRRH